MLPCKLVPLREERALSGPFSILTPLTLMAQHEVGPNFQLTDCEMTARTIFPEK